MLLHINNFPEVNASFKFAVSSVTNVIYVCSVVHCVQVFVTPWTVARQAPLSMGFPRQEYWSGLPFPSPGDLLYEGIKSASPATPKLAGGFFTT